MPHGHELVVWIHLKLPCYNGSDGLCEGKIFKLGGCDFFRPQVLFQQTSLQSTRPKRLIPLCPNLTNLLQNLIKFVLPPKPADLRISVIPNSL